MGQCLLEHVQGPEHTPVQEWVGAGCNMLTDVGRADVKRRPNKKKNGSAGAPAQAKSHEQAKKKRKKTALAGARNCFTTTRETVFRRRRTDKSSRGRHVLRM